MKNLIIAIGITMLALLSFTSVSQTKITRPKPANKTAIAKSKAKTRAHSSKKNRRQQQRYNNAVDSCDEYQWGGYNYSNIDTFSAADTCAAWWDADTCAVWDGGDDSCAIW